MQQQKLSMKFLNRWVTMCQWIRSVKSSKRRTVKSVNWNMVSWEVCLHRKVVSSDLIYCFCLVVDQYACVTISYPLFVHASCPSQNQNILQVIKCVFHLLDKQVDLSSVDLKKLKVKDLKKILEEWGESCKGCVEKSDFIRKINELMPKYAPNAAKARTDL